MWLVDQKIKEMGYESEYWNDIFSVTCWLLWRRRNELVHNNACPSMHEAIAEVKGIMRCMAKAKRVLKNTGGLNSHDRGTIAMENEVLRVLVDGAFSSTSDIVGCGGIIRLRNGEIKGGFVCTMKGSNSLVAELWGCIWGLRRAWALGYKEVRILCDASQVIEGVYGADVDLHEDKDQIMTIRELLNREWQAEITLIRREDNEEADQLARRSFMYELGAHC